MARTHIGRLSLGGVIALCAILLLAPETRSQNIRVGKQKFQISGSIGVPNVTLQGLGTPAPTTDGNGVYSAEVDYGWSGTVKPVKLGYTFKPAERSYTKVTSHMSGEDYEASLLKYTITGSVGLPGVKMTGLPGDPVTDDSGRYTATVEYGWSGAATPEKMGYRFEPSTQMYSQVSKNEMHNYKHFELKMTISGSVGVGGVVLKGLPGDPVSKPDGSYSGQVGWSWSGKVMPTKEGHQFTPESRDYSVVTDNLSNEDYTVQVFTYEISGSTGLPGVVLKGLPDDPMTDTNGYYTAVVQYGWSGKVTPEKAGYTFDPQSKEYGKVVANQPDQNYNPAPVYYTLSGKTGTGNVTLEGLPGDPTSDATGFYSVKVEYGWSGFVTPKKDGWYFDPPNPQYDAVTKDQKQDYIAKPVTYRISGNVGQAGVMLRGLPKSPVSGSDGSYSDEVSYNWKGTVTPMKAGFTFEPAKREYADVLSDLSSEDYTANIIRYTISGRVMGDGGPLADVLILADGDIGSTMTDANGEFQFEVGYGWRGKLTPDLAGYTFSPTMKSFDGVTQNTANQVFTAKLRMVTITNRIAFEDDKGTLEPIADVSITARPGNFTATTDRNGKYSIRVPYDWTGELVLDKPGFVFDPNTVPFANVREDIDGTKPPAPRGPTPGQTPGQMPGQSPGQIPAQGPGQIPGQTPGQTPGQGPGQTPAQPPGQDSGQTPGANALLLQQITQVRQQLSAAQDQELAIRVAGGQVPAHLQQTISQLQQQLNALVALAGSSGTLPPGTTPPVVPPTVDTTPPGFGPNLIDVLMMLSQQTGAKIGIDATVKPIPVSVGFPLASVPVPEALRRIVLGTGYDFHMVENNTYLVFKPVTQMFTGDDLRQALLDLSSVAEIPIVPDPNMMAYQVYADIRNQPVEKALEIMLAGTPFVVKRMPNYILVADKSVSSPAFVDISESRVVQTNYKTPDRVKSLLSPAFDAYVKSESMDPTDPNNRGHMLLVTAPPAIADRIVADIRRTDVRPRQVLLDARVVVMERGDLLNLGVQWGWPTLRAGTLWDSALDNVTDIGSTSLAGIQLGYTSGREFTDSLLAAINLLQENSQLDIVSSPQILAQDGRRSVLRQVTEEWFFMTGPTSELSIFTNSELQKIESGTVLSITPHIGDNNDINLELAIEVSDSIPRGRGSDLPVVTRRTAQNAVTVEDGGTVALAGLTESRSRSKDSRVPWFSELPLIGPLFKNNDSDKVTREIAVFVTARLVPERGDLAAIRTPATAPTTMRGAGFPSATNGALGPMQPARNNELSRADLEDALARQNR